MFFLTAIFDSFDKKRIQCAQKTSTTSPYCRLIDTSVPNQTNPMEINLWLLFAKAPTTKIALASRKIARFPITHQRVGEKSVL